jgi:hypothetical protein
MRWRQGRRVKPSVEARILELRAKGDGILKIGKKLGIGTSVVQRVFKGVDLSSENPRLKGVFNRNEQAAARR